MILGKITFEKLPWSRPELLNSLEEINRGNCLENNHSGHNFLMEHFPGEKRALALVLVTMSIQINLNSNFQKT